MDRPEGCLRQIEGNVSFYRHGVRLPIMRWAFYLVTLLYLIADTYSNLRVSEQSHPCPGIQTLHWQLEH